MNRIIGEFSGVKNGVLVIAFGAVHGNEMAGVYALENIFRILKSPQSMGKQIFHGKIIGLIGNVKAAKLGVRYIDRDLNRICVYENSEKIEFESFFSEKYEFFEIVKIILDEIQRTKPSTLLLLDLHTTSAEGGIFAIPIGQNEENIDLSRKMGVPVVDGLLDYISGTLLQFFSKIECSIQQFWPEKTISVAFEGGQNDDPISIQRCMIAISNILELYNGVNIKNIFLGFDNFHRYHLGKSEVYKIEYAHRISSTDNFQMLPGFANFQHICQFEHLANDKKGKILAPFESVILMPLYQKQGNEGFFLAKKVNFAGG